MNPQGGAIAYLGNTTVGLGLAGSAQLVDEVARYIKATANPWLADALKQAHTNLPKTDSFKVPIIGVSVPVMSDESWDWTEKASVLLGDAVIPVWKAARPGPPVVTATKTPACNSSELTFTIAPASQGTLRFYAGGSYYEVALTGQATVQATIAGDPQSIQVGFESSQTLYGYWDLAL
jgi:hypothetical protein